MRVEYYGGRLAPWFDVGPNRKFCFKAAERGGRRFTDLARAVTPVGQYVDGRVGGRLKAGWRERPVVVFDQGVGEAYQSGTENSVPYAHYVENGTGLWGPSHARYRILPRKPGGWLRWIDPVTMSPVFARSVMHPGIPPQHMTQKAAARLEAGLGQLVARPLREWAREVENQNHSGLRLRR